MRLLLPLVLLAALAAPAAAQRIAYIDSEYILGRVPEYRTAEQEINRQAQQWQAELDAVAEEVAEMEREYAARELLFTEDEQARRLDAIAARRRDLDALRTRYFGAEGEMFREQTRLMRPIQERVLEAVEEVARQDDYDYVFDKSGDYVFLYARPQLDVSDLVLEELGIDAATVGSR